MSPGGTLLLLLGGQGSPAPPSPAPRIPLWLLRRLAAGAPGPATARAPLWWLLLACGGSAKAPPEELRDDRVLLAARQLLDDTGQFSRVECGHGPDDWDFAAEDRAYALLWLDDQNEIDDGMSGDQADVVHTATYMLRIAVRDEDPVARQERIQRLGSVAKNNLDGVSIGDITFPAFTKLRQARREGSARFPDAYRTYRGEWQYIVAGFGRHDESDLED